jgi:hypothetical protein
MATKRTSIATSTMLTAIASSRIMYPFDSNRGSCPQNGAVFLDDRFRQPHSLVNSRFDRRR